MRREAPTARMITTAVHHARSGMSLLKDVAALAASAAEETVFFLTPLDFIELVLTYFTDLRILGEELIVNRHYQPFQWSHDHILNLIIVKQLFRIIPTKIHSLNFVFAPYEI